MPTPQVTFDPSKNQIEIIDLDDLYHRRDSLEHDPGKPHRTNFHLLIYIQQGSGAHFIDFAPRQFEDHSFIFVREHQVHAFDFSNHLQGKAILFTKDFVEAIQKSMAMPVFSPVYLNKRYCPVFKPSDALRESCVNLLLEVDKESKEHLHNSSVLMFLFSSLLLMIEREKSLSKEQVLSQKQQTTFTRFIQLLEAQFTQTRNAADYAEQLNTTYKTLNQLCKLATDKTAKELIDAYTILEAKRRLILEKQPIQQLADALGFDEATNFVKYFKKHTSQTPTEFKKST